MDYRKVKGYEITQKKQVRTVKDGWLVKSQSGDWFYKVSDVFVCDCPDSELHKTTCKHSYAVRYYLDVEKHKPSGIMNERVQLTYNQAWSAYNEAQIAEGRLFDNLLADLVKEVADHRPIQAHGRPYTDFNIILYTTIKKVYSQMSSRRAVSLFGISKEKGHIEKVPHFNAGSKLLNREDIIPILHQLIAITAAPLKAVETDFAVDSSGFRTRCFGAYAENKYGLNRQHRWLKAHICCGIKTNIVTAIEITEENGADYPQFIPLVQETAHNGFNLKEISADKAYSGRDNLAFVDNLNATPFIPFRAGSTSKPKGNNHIWRKMFHYFEYNKDEFLEHYHKRSNVESVFSAIKKKLRETLKSKNHTAQVNELLCKFVAYNIMVLIHEIHEFGIIPNFAQ